MGLKIKTVTGAEFEVHGVVEYNAAMGIYYCAGQSFPAEIVTEVFYFRLKTS